MPAIVARSAPRSGRRRRSLDPWIERLRRSLAARPGGPGPLELEIEGESVGVPAWAAGEIEATFGPNEQTDSGRGMILAQAVALRMKIAADRVRLRKARLESTTSAYAVQAELMLDSAIALALKRELQRLIDGEVQQGRMGQAKAWSGFKNTLHRDAAAVKELLAESQFQRAQELSAKLTDLPREQQRSTDRFAPVMRQLEAQEFERRRIASARRMARVALTHLPSRTEILIGILAVATASWFGFVKLPSSFATQPVELTLEDLPRRDGIVAIRSSAPSLYATVDEAAWAAMDLDDRNDLTRTVASVLLANGYTGTRLATADGRPVAQWLIMKGVRVLDDVESTRRPGIPAPSAQVAEP